MLVPSPKITFLSFAMNRLLLFLILFSGTPGPITGVGQVSDPASDPNRDIRFEQYFNQSVDPTIEFTDERGQTVVLGKYFNQRPLVLAMGYYRCPMLCGVVLNAFVQSLQDLPPTLAMRDFNFIFVSIDPKETSELARVKLEDYLRRYGWAPAAARWHFLTGSVSASRRLADEIGFKYRYDSVTRQFVHPSGLVVLTPTGKISGYLLGIEYPAKDIEEAVAAARREHVSSPVQPLTLLCFSQNVVPGSVAFVVLFVLRAAALLTLLGFVLLIRYGTRRAKKDVTT